MWSHSLRNPCATLLRVGWEKSLFLSLVSILWASEQKKFCPQSDAIFYAQSCFELVDFRSLQFPLAHKVDEGKRGTPRSLSLWESGWHSGHQTRLPPLWSSCVSWVDVDLNGPRRFSPGTSVFSPLKTCQDNYFMMVTHPVITRLLQQCLPSETDVKKWCRTHGKKKIRVERAELKGLGN